MEVEPMQRHWSEQELETYWSFSSDELTLIPHRDASSRLGVAASLKFFQLEGFFPSSVKAIPSVAMDHMAKLLGVDPQAIADYDWQGRTGARYRERLRTAMGIRPSTAEDFKAVAGFPIVFAKFWGLRSPVEYCADKRPRFSQILSSITH
jgi:hypothetical protein